MLRDNIKNLLLPPNTTDQLQVMDLVVNAPVKSAIRRERADCAYEYFLKFKLACLEEREKPQNEQQIIAWKPPKPALHEGLKTISTLHDEVFCDESFKEGLRSAFVRACQQWQTEVFCVTQARPRV